jgi:hypothetical protein
LNQQKETINTYFQASSYYSAAGSSGAGSSTLSKTASVEFFFPALLGAGLALVLLNFFASALVDA